MTLFVEAISVGFSVMAVGLVIASVWLWGLKMGMSEKMWNQWYPYYDQLTSRQTLQYAGILGMILFLTGVAVHLIAEWSGVNRWYCKNGSACKRAKLD